MPDTTTWYRPPADPDDDSGEFRETVPGGHALIVERSPGHALVVEYGDCEFYLSCQCGVQFAVLKPNREWVLAVQGWLTHDHWSTRPVTAHCQCGAPLEATGMPVLGRAWLNSAAVCWERHTMTEVRS